MKRVLLVDDDCDQLELRRMILESAGMDVRVARCVDSARQIFKSDTPTHVVMDLRMPRLEDGLSLIRSFRDASPGLQLFVVTGNEGGLDRAPEARMVDEVFRKPVHSSQLIERLSGASAAA